MTIDTMKKRRHAYIISHTNKFTLTLSFGVLDVTNFNDYQKWPFDVDVKSK